MFTKVKMAYKIQMKNKNNNIEKDVHLEINSLSNNQLIELLTHYPYPYGQETLTLNQLMIRKDDYHDLIKQKHTI